MAHASSLKVLCGHQPVADDDVELVLCEKTLR